MTQTDDQIFSRRFRDVWKKLFPEVAFPETERIAVTYMANQICMLRRQVEVLSGPGPHLMQSREAIDRAHDVFGHMILDPLMCTLITPTMREMFITYMDALCWVLKHADGYHTAGDELMFPKNLALVEMAIAAAGQGFVVSGEMGKFKM